MIDTLTGATKRYAVNWPDGYHVEQRVNGGVLLGPDGSVIARDGDRFADLQVCSVTDNTIEVDGLGPLPGASPAPSPSTAR